MRGNAGNAGNDTETKKSEEQPHPQNLLQVNQTWIFMN